ncbi:hypothetical protein V2J09_011722 [Rumex salicifolius]
MEEPINPTTPDEKLRKEAPQLVAVLKEMKEGLDNVTSKVKDLTAQVKAKRYPTGEGISYLEAKHLLLLNYCQSIVYYMLRKAKGLSIEGHPLVRSLVETRLFLEKIRPIDKRFEYQFQKLTKVANNDLIQTNNNEKQDDAQMPKDLLDLRPNPDMLIPKIDSHDGEAGGVYRPPKIAPTTMGEERTKREERNARRKEKETLKEAKSNGYMRYVIDNMEGRPEEVRETIGTESVEMSRFLQQYEERSRQEENLFTRAPITKAERKKTKHLLKSRNGLMGLTESFYDEIKSLPLGDGVEEQSAVGSGMKKSHQKRKVCWCILPVEFCYFNAPILPLLFMLLNLKTLIRSQYF